MSPFSTKISFTRALRVAGYNWPLYAAAATGMVLGLILVFLPNLPPLVRWLAGIEAAVALWYSVASFGAFHLMFDRSDLLTGRWLPTEIHSAPRRWVQINVGLEETSLPLAQVFPGSEGKSLDLFSPAIMTEPAVTRARQQFTNPSEQIQLEALPVMSGWADMVVVTLAAHEIRDEQQRQLFFQELRRIVSRNGTVVVVEHLRNLAATLAFGPGLLHFYPRSEWLRLGKHASLVVERERSITPFIRVFFYRPADRQQQFAA